MPVQLARLVRKELSQENQNTLDTTGCVIILSELMYYIM